MLITQIASYGDRLATARSGGLSVGFVPTMGALHPGHLSLIRRAAADNAFVACSIYVNPLQFGSSQDLATYPRDLRSDLVKAVGAGADMVFAPTEKELFKRPLLTTVMVGALADRLEGTVRPDHFSGMATVVTKLLSLTGVCRAYFGEKDFQQLAIIRAMVLDLSLPVDVVGCPTVREIDGLAMSSRNVHLSATQRRSAPRLYEALEAGRAAVEDKGAEDPDEVEETMSSWLKTDSSWSMDYAAVVDPDDLRRPAQIDRSVRLMIAGQLGNIRLIDNLAAKR